MTALRFHRQPCNVRRARAGYAIAVFSAVAAGLLIVLLAGCKAPAKDADKALARVEASKKKETEIRGDATEKAKTFVHGTALALAGETNPTPAVVLAQKLNTRAGLTLGAPGYDAALNMESIVRDALSPLVDRQRESEARLARMDGTLVGIQSMLARQQNTTAKAEVKRDETLLDVAAEAQTWVAIKRWFKWGLFGLGFLFIAPIALKIAALFFPFLAEIAGIFDSVVGGLARSLFRALPAAAEKAGYVAQEVHARTEATAVDLVQAINKAKADKQVWAGLKPHLLQFTDDTTDAEIERIKREHGVV